jgi:hypothetical protein
MRAGKAVRPPCRQACTLGVIKPTGSRSAWAKSADHLSLGSASYSQSVPSPIKELRLIVHSTLHVDVSLNSNSTHASW